VRLANLRSGQLDFIERLRPSDVPQVKSDARFKLTKITEIGYQGITINVGKSDLAQKNPLGRDRRVREAFELALDRDGIVQVAIDGEATSATSGSRRRMRSTRRNADSAARRRAREGAAAGAGVPNPSFTLMTPTTADAQRSRRSCRRWHAKRAST
jgi:peptide/nickel transport system substrate-binding protein